MRSELEFGHLYCPTEVRTSACMQASGMMASSEEEPLKGADRLTARLEARLFS